jgi:hypothetical protein
MMRHYLRFAVAFLAVASTCAAQFAPCKVSKPSSGAHREGITELRVGFLEPSGEREAHIFVPDSDTPIPGIVFSHSSIHSANTRVDLPRFARGLALAGAASIVLDGTIEWETPNDNSKQPYHLMACASHWLLENVDVDRQRLAQAGPGAWVGTGGYYCVEAEPLPCYHSQAILNFGETSNAEFRNTERMLTRAGRLEMAQWTQRELNLKEINPEWFEPVSSHRKH